MCTHASLDCGSSQAVLLSSGGCFSPSVTPKAPSPPCLQMLLRLPVTTRQRLNSSAGHAKLFVNWVLAYSSSLLAFGYSRMCQALDTSQGFVMPFLPPEIPIDPCPGIWSSQHVRLTSSPRCLWHLAFFPSLPSWPECTRVPRCPVYLSIRALKEQQVGFPCRSVDSAPREQFSWCPVPSTVPGPVDCSICRCRMKDWIQDIT